MTRINIRPARQDEWQTLANVFKAARRFLEAEYGVPCRYEAVDYWYENIVVPSGNMLVAEFGGKPAGVMELAGRMVEQLYVDPAVRGQGVGRALINHATKTTDQPLELVCFACNDQALGFYEKFGFQAVENRDGTHNEEGLPEVVLKR